MVDLLHDYDSYQDANSGCDTYSVASFLKKSKFLSPTGKKGNMTSREATLPELINNNEEESLASGAGVTFSPRQIYERIDPQRYQK
jgi:hypothetical protein